MHIQKLIHKPRQWCRTSWSHQWFHEHFLHLVWLRPRQKPVSSQFHMRCAYVGEVCPRFTNPIFLKKVVNASNHPEMICLFAAKALFTERCWGFLSISCLDHLFRKPSHQSRPGCLSEKGFGRSLSFRYWQTTSPTICLVSPKPSSCSTWWYQWILMQNSYKCISQSLVYFTPRDLMTMYTMSCIWICSDVYHSCNNFIYACYVHGVMFMLLTWHVTTISCSSAHVSTVGRPAPVFWLIPFTWSRKVV